MHAIFILLLENLIEKILCHIVRIHTAYLLYVCGGEPFIRKNIKMRNWKFKNSLILFYCYITVRFEFVVNLLPHFSHWYWISPAVHSYGFSPSCVAMWRFFLKKRIKKTDLNSKNSEVVSNFYITINWSDLINPLPHFPHFKGLSLELECVCTWDFLFKKI